MGDNKITIKNEISHDNTIMFLGKTFSFTPDEANFDDLVKACDLLIIILFIENPDLCVIYRVKNRMRNIHALNESYIIM